MQILRFAQNDRNLRVWRQESLSADRVLVLARHGRITFVTLRADVGPEYNAGQLV